MSIFQPIILSSLHSDEFWLETTFLPKNLQTDQQLFSGVLEIRDSKIAFRKVSMHLTSTSLYYYTQENTVKSADIRWLILSAFTETSDLKGEQYGFSLKSLVEAEDFYAESESDLKVWLNLLSEISIMSDFETHYIILKNLNSGYFGEVKLCVNLDTNEQFAVKILEKSRLTNKRMLKCLYNEILIQKKLNHRNITKLYKVFEDATFVYLIMEYVKEGNLLKRIERGSIDPVEAINFSKNLVEVVLFMHAQGIVHRDLKPENILLEEKNSISMFKLADFGFAYFSAKKETKCSGSPGYIAPEILRGNSYDSKIDIFSIGVISYELLTRFSPFKGQTLQEIVRENSKCKIFFGHSILRTVPLFTQNFLKKLLSPDPELRPSASDILKIEWRWNPKGIELTSSSSSSLHTFSGISSKFNY